MIGCPAISGAWWYISLCSASVLTIYKVYGCAGNQGDYVASNDHVQGAAEQEVDQNGTITLTPLHADRKRQRVEFGHSINTAANECLPVLNQKSNKLFFSAMNRTGYFGFKLHFIKEKSAGAEGLLVSELIDSVLQDARSFTDSSRAGHEVLPQVFNSGELLLMANYQEKLGSKKKVEPSIETTDLFCVINTPSGFQTNHFPEPTNSIYTETEGWKAEDVSSILFVSDPPGNIGEYQEKGWKWNNSSWGNTDHYDWGFRETNFRPRYEVHGMPVGAVNFTEVTKIYLLQQLAAPLFTETVEVFEFNSFRIRQEYHKALLSLADQISQDACFKVEVLGHIDDIGHKRDNQSQSLQRAESIKAYLIDEKVTNTIITRVFGSSIPIVPNTTKKRTMNRRVGIYLRPNINQ